MKTLTYIIILTGFLTACSQKEPNDKNQSLASQPPAEITTNVVVATGRVEPEQEIIQLSASEGGVVRKTYKKEGDIVEQGETIVQLEDDREQSKINEIQIAIETQQNQVQVENNLVAEVETNLAYKISLLEKAKKLVTKAAETQQTVDDLSTEVDLLKVKLSETRSKIQVVQNKVRELKAQLNTNFIELRKKSFNAPVRGQILKMIAKKGSAVAEFDTYAEFAPTGDYIIKAEVDELFADRIKLGQQVDILPTGSTKVMTTGEIFYVAPYLKKKSLFSEKTDEQEDRRVREIKLRLKNKESLLINAKVECKIKL